MTDEMSKKPVDAADCHSATGSKTPTEENSPEARRNWIKAGIIGIPVILTLKGKPAWANESVATSGGSIVANNDGE
jgi:hypothetical protein